MRQQATGGWWSAEPGYAGESSRVLLHFLEENGKPSVRLSLLGIGGYDVPIGTVTIAGNTPLDAASGKELWKHYYWFSWIESPPVVREQVVYTGSSGVVYAADLAAASMRCARGG